MFSAGAFFCGMGGFCAGFESNGFRTIWANDFDRNVKNTYQYFIRQFLENIETE